MSELALVPVDRLRRIVDEWIAGHDTAEEAYRRLAAATGRRPDTWRKRLSDLVVPSPRGDWRGWWSYSELDAADVDELLVAMDATQLWYSELGLADHPGLKCEDCGRHITVETGYRPLDLFRPDPAAQEGIVWDRTKQKLVRRPRQARAGGRRFRKFDLCRRCAGEALRVRASTNPKVGHKGRLGVLRTRDRVEPKRGGRPRLLTDVELQNLHLIYLRQGLSMADLARELAEKRDGKYSGYSQAILYGWRRLGLQLRPKSEQQALAHHLRGRKPRRPERCPASTAKGTRCQLYVKIGGSYCVSHQHLEQVAA